MSQVFLFSGHMIDTPDRDTPRFPPDREDAVRARMAEVLAGWGVGRGDVCICSGARGGDLLFAELCLERGAEVRVFLALERAAFVAASVRLPEGNGPDWEARFDRVLGEAVVQGPEPDMAQDDQAFAENNTRMIAAAREAAEGAPVSVLLVWDGKDGGVGGTGDVARQVQDIAGRIAIVDPTRA